MEYYIENIIFLLLILKIKKYCNFEKEIIKVQSIYSIYNHEI